VQKGDFLLTEPIKRLPEDRTFNPLEIVSKEEVK
jgi:hypothetical protein